MSQAPLEERPLTNGPVDDAIRVAGLRVRFGAGERAGKPNNLRDWNVDPPGTDDASWSVLRVRSSAAERIAIHPDRGVVELTAVAPRPTYAEALVELLIHQEVLPLHAAAFLRSRDDRDAILLCGPSGQGKSSLAWLAALRGHPLISDDHIGLRRSQSGLEVVPLKKSVAVERERLRIVPEGAKSETMAVGGVKLRFDPSAAGVARSYAGVPKRIVLLERGNVRRITPLDPSAAFARLLPVSGVVRPSAKRLMPLLKELALTTTAVVAELTAQCLDDGGVLQELGV